MRKISQKGQANNIVIIVVILMVVVLAGWYLLKKKASIPTPPNQPNPQVQSNKPAYVPIRNDNDLQKALSDLDEEDIDNTVDSQLSQNEADAQAF